MKRHFGKALFLFFLLFTFTTAQANTASDAVSDYKQAIQACVDQKIELHRQEVGQDAWIRQDFIWEWEDECEEAYDAPKANDTPPPPEEVVTPPTDDSPPQPMFEPIIRPSASDAEVDYNLAVVACMEEKHAQKLAQLQQDIGPDATVSTQFFLGWELECKSATEMPDVWEYATITPQDTLDVEVSLGHNHIGSPKVFIQAIDDEVVIWDIVANRGNCPLIFRRSFEGKRLVYGEELTVLASCPARTIRDVDIITGHGEFRVTFGR